MLSVGVALDGDCKEDGTFAFSTIRLKLAFSEISNCTFKTSHVTWWPSLKRLSGIQVQLLSLCMGKHQILQNCSLSLRLNFIFEITNEIGQQLCHKCCFFSSNSVYYTYLLSQISVEMVHR